MWSINESYSRPTLAIVTTIVAVATYAVTLNLNNIARGLNNLLAPRRRALIEQMEQDPDWRRIGDRFKEFQRAEGGQRKPSEWTIVLFLASRVLFGVWGMAWWVVGSVRPNRDDESRLPGSTTAAGSVSAAASTKGKRVNT
jgi:hypothetical protein